MTSVVFEQVSTVDAPSKEEEAFKHVKSGVLLSMGGGLIPIPIVDLVGIAGAQTQMIVQLSELYKIPYSEHRIKNLIATLIGSLGTGFLATRMVASVVKTVPFVGGLAGMVSLPIVAGASTYALGKVFIHHFEAGGTVLDFDPDETKAYFAQQFAEGKLVAGTLKERPAAGENPAASARSAGAPSKSPSSAAKPVPNDPKVSPSVGGASPVASTARKTAEPSPVSRSTGSSSSPKSQSTLSPSPSSTARSRPSRGRSKPRSDSDSAKS